MLLNTKEGIHVTGPVVPIIAAAPAGAVVVFTIPVLAGQLIGVKSVKVHKVMLRNNIAGTTTVSLGTGGAGIGVPAILPAFDSINNLTDSYIANTDFPEVEVFAATISAWAAALGVGTTIDVQLEVIVCG
jgi:hypothetical protein